MKSKRLTRNNPKKVVKPSSKTKKEQAAKQQRRRRKNALTLLPAALLKPIIISVPRPHCWKGSASKPYVELPPHTAPLGMEVGPTQACAVKVVVHDLHCNYPRYPPQRIKHTTKLHKQTTTINQSEEVGKRARPIRSSSLQTFDWLLSLLASYLKKTSEVSSPRYKRAKGLEVIPITQTSFPSRLPVALPPPRETLGEDHATIEKGKPTSEFDHEFTA
ncbi:hypothetical protein L484_018330 [Morus notabilis]|uniref:Uncharacterized protein n=1 Tax=Morus notabilis TaxID=981085 RepID=W9QNU3_9ROSA|nr:hypothetical protein L484_018330 [Morus notabilis]